MKHEQARPGSAPRRGMASTGSIPIGSVFGIELRLDFSWFLAFILIVWSLAGQIFPLDHPGWSPRVNWTLAVITALLFFASLVAHELAHSLVSRTKGVPVRDITLFIFGGVAHIEREPETAGDEAAIALAGPATSLVLSAVFLGISALAGQVSEYVQVLTNWLGVINLVPGFPLDGGRVLRAIVWGITGNLERANRLATRVGQLVAVGFVSIGFWQLLRGNWGNGLWIAFIGWFLFSAATSSYEQSVTLKFLARHTVREIMLTDLPHVPGRLTLDVLVQQVALPSGRRCFPVVDDGVVGLVTLHQVQRVAPERWPTTRVEEIMVPRAELVLAESSDDLAHVLERMANADINQLPVIDQGRLVGMVTRENLLNFINLRTQSVI